jgi:ribosomal protein L15
MKGQGARRTRKHPRFEGGQNPLYKRLPKITMRRLEHMLEYISLEKIFYGAQRGWLNLNEEINLRALSNAGLISKPRHGCELRIGVRPDFQSLFVA